MTMETPTTSLSDRLAVDRPEPPSLLSGAWRVARISPFRVLRGKRLIMLLLLNAVPILIVLGAVVLGQERALGLRRFVDFAALSYLTAIFPVTLLFLGASALGDDLDNGTLFFMRLQPIPRAAIVLGRWISTVFSAAILFIPALALLYVLQVGWIDATLLAEQAKVLLGIAAVSVVAAFSYGSLFLLLSMHFKRAVVIGLFWIAGWEVAVSHIPSSAAFWTVSFHVANLVGAITREGRVIPSHLRPFETAEKLPEWSMSLTSLLIAVVCMLALACYAFSRREYLESAADS